MLSEPGHKLVPNVLLGVAEEHKAIGVKPVPSWLNLSDYHRLHPLGNKWDIRGGLDHGNLDAFSGLADTIAGAA
jgi:hypothetical protein